MEQPSEPVPIPEFQEEKVEWSDHPEAPFLTNALMTAIREAETLEELKVALLATFSAMNSYPDEYSEWQQRIAHKVIATNRRVEGIERKTRQISRGSR